MLERLNGKSQILNTSDENIGGGGNFPSVEYFEPETKSVLSDTSELESTVSEVELLNQPLSLLEVENAGGDISLFVGDLIEVRSHSNAVKFVGELKTFDQKNGIITLMTKDGEVRIAAVRESFLM